MDDYWIPRFGSGMENIQCFNDDDLYIQSEKVFQNFGSVDAKFEYCIDAEGTDKESCLSKDEAAIELAKIQIFLQVFYMQIDMKSDDEPIYEVSKHFTINS